MLGCLHAASRTELTYAMAVEIAESDTVVLPEEEAVSLLSREARRVQVLRSYDVLDSLPETVYDDITLLASQICKTPIASITLVDANRQWCKSTYGIDGGDSPREHGLCSYAVENGDDIFIIPDTHGDTRFANNPYVTGDPGIRFYAGVLLMSPEGYALGTLCVIDREPRQFDADQRKALRALSRQVTVLLEERRNASALRKAHRARKMMHAALERSEALFREAYENAPIGIALVSTEGHWLRVNKALCDILGYDAEQLLNTTFQTITYPEDLEADLRLVQQMLSRQLRTYQMEKRYCHRAGHLVWAQLNVSLVWDNDQPMYFVAQIQDISERKHAERAKVEFLAMVSHELRTPVTALRGATRLLTSGSAGELPAKAQSLVSLADRNADRLHRLVSDILDQEKMESGAFEYRKTQIDIEQLAEQAAQELTGYAEQYHVTIETHCRMPQAMVDADPDRIMQVLANLISNAIKFSPQGARVEIHVEPVSDRVRVSVVDHGSGIPEEFHPHIFKKFAQANSTATNRKGGSGLGLNISRSIVEQHGGTLAFRTAAGVGTTFYFELPAINPSRLEPTK
ncbi:MAG: ATP-binding protein [Steroidobacter sp.]